MVAYKTYVTSVFLSLQLRRFAHILTGWLEDEEEARVVSTLANPLHPRP